MVKMKDSGIEWIGEIPEDWKVTKVKHHFNNKKEIVGYKVDSYERLALTMNGVIKRSKTDANGLQPEKFETYQILRENELVFKLIDLQNITTSRVGLSKYIGLVSPAYIIIHSCGNILPCFAEKYFFAMWYFQIFNALGDNGVRSSLSTNDLLNLTILNPPIKKQKRIADFLDGKCRKIDSLKSDIQKQIENLEQYKKSVITEAVTKGINPDAKMKDSGSKWISQVPEHWKMDKLKYNLVVHEVKGYGDKEVLSLYRELGIVQKNSRDDNHNVTSEDTSKYKYVRKGDFVINKMKAWQGSVAVSDYEGIVSPAYYVYEFINKKYDKKYFHHLMRNKILADEFRRISGGIREGQWDLDRVQFENMYFPVPPKSEQIEIANYIESKYGNIEKSIELKQKQLETLEEYKKSLIFEYVTGKKEVQ